MGPAIFAEYVIAIKKICQNMSVFVKLSDVMSKSRVFFGKILDNSRHGRTAKERGQYMIFKKKTTSQNAGTGDIPNPGPSPKTNPVKKMGGILKKGGLGVVVIILLIFLGMNSFYTVSEQEQAVVVTFGSPKAVTTSGLHFKIPLIQSVHKVNTTIQGFAIGYDEATNESNQEGVMITSDYNFVDVDFFCEYRVSDPVAYLYNSKEPVNILKNVSQSCIRTVISSYDVDSVLTTGKNEIQAAIKEMIMDRLAEDDIGIQLVNISIQDAEPPITEVMQAFKAVETAKQGKETAINNANKYRNENLPAAEAEADQIVQDAEAQKQQRINEAEAQVARFAAMYQEYQKNPTVTKQRMFYEAMEEVLPDLKIVIDNGSGVQTVLPLDSFVSDMQQSSSAEE